MAVRLVASFQGRVQGVGFRATVLHHARGLAVAGFVCNEPDGSVTLDADGDKQELQELLNRIQARPAGELDHCDVTWDNSLDRQPGLRIRY